MATLVLLQPWPVSASIWTSARSLRRQSRARRTAHRGTVRTDRRWISPPWPAASTLDAFASKLADALVGLAPDPEDVALPVGSTRIHRRCITCAPSNSGGPAKAHAEATPGGPHEFSVDSEVDMASVSAPSTNTVHTKVLWAVGQVAVAPDGEGARPCGGRLVRPTGRSDVGGLVEAEAPMSPTAGSSDCVSSISRSMTAKVPQMTSRCRHR